LNSRQRPLLRGLSELTAAIILLVIAVVLSAVIFAFFYSYSNRLSNMITSSVVGGCGLVLMKESLIGTLTHNEALDCRGTPRGNDLK